jgi:hypothetical protein
LAEQGANETAMAIAQFVRVDQRPARLKGMGRRFRRKILAKGMEIFALGNADIQQRSRLKFARVEPEKSAAI